MAYRMIQVGLGDFGQRWMDVISNHESWQYAAIATRNADARAACGQQTGVPAERQFATLDEALAAGIEADVLLVTTPHFRHPHDVAAGLSHGLHVLVEKPLAGTWEDCLWIRGAATHARGILMVGENYRFGTGARIARELVASGEIGTPEFLCMEYFVGHSFPEGDWRNDYTYPLLVENTTHQFDLVRYVTGTNAEKVYCDAFASERTPHWKAPTLSASFRMTGGLRFQFGASWAYDEFQTPWEGNWRLHGSKGTVSWRQDQIEVRRGEDARIIDVPSKPSDHTLKATLEELTAALDGGRTPETNIADNMETVAMVYGAMRSAETGSPVSIRDMLAETS